MTLPTALAQSVSNTCSMKASADSLLQFAVVTGRSVLVGLSSAADTLCSQVS